MLEKNDSRLCSPQTRTEPTLWLRQVFRIVLACLVMLLPFSVLGQNPQPNIQYTNKAVDLGLRSDLKVNPSTQALEIGIPLGDYPGRAGLNLPVTLSYSSKVLRLNYEGYNPGAMDQHGNPIGNGYTITAAKYGEHSAAGWTSTLGFPVLDTSGTNSYNQSGNAVRNDGGTCLDYVSIGGGFTPISCLFVDRLLVWMPDGSSHELRSSDQPYGTGASLPDNLYSVDGSRLRYQRSTDTLFMPDGSRYLISAGQYIDRNGNKLIYSNGQWTDTLGRTINNPPLFGTSGTYVGSAGDYSYSLPGVGGNLNYTLKWRKLDDPGVLTTPGPLQYIANTGCPYGTGNYSPYIFTGISQPQACIANGGNILDPVVLYQIVLPHDPANPNPPTYTFTYNVYGEIDKVILPTGGYERYQYAQISPLSSMTYPYLTANRGIINRRVSASGSGADELLWQYSGGGGAVTITAPDGSMSGLSTYTDTSLLGTFGYSLDQARAGRISGEAFYSAPDGTGNRTLLRRKLTQWTVTGSNATGQFPNAQQYATRNARVTKEVEIILDTGGPALVRTTTHEYDTTYEFATGVNETAIKEYDYVAVDQSTAQTLDVGSAPIGPLLRRTEKTYLDATNQSYRDRNLLGLVTSVTVKDGASPANVLAQSSIGYDESSLLTYGSVANWTDPGPSVPRGNATTAGHWLNFNGSSISTFPAGTYVVTHAQYDQCGSVRVATDAKGNQSQVSYADAFADYPRNTYAYPTSTTSAVPDSTGLYGSNSAFSTTSIYDFNTGRVMSTTDANSRMTTIDYTDALNRVKTVTRPDGGVTSYNYNDVPGALYVETLTKQDSTRNIDAYQFFDGMGRPNRSFFSVGNGNYNTVDTQYDSMGRVYRVSNPYLSTGSASTVNPSGNWTTSAFDALGRVISVTTPDAAQVVTAYGGSTSGTLGTTVTVTAPAPASEVPKRRRSLTDALGRLVRVDEPDKDSGLLDSGSSPIQSTYYTYDILGNLKRVDQGGQHRYFLYDSLSRLIRARNPEQMVNSAITLNDPYADPAYPNNQWSMGYTYDANGNLLTRTDARGVMATYDYDALNRNKTIVYSTDPASTATVTRRYDGWGPDENGNPMNYNIPNGKGRAWRTETSGSTGTRVTIDSFDVMGRPTKQKQQFYNSGSWSQPYVIQRGYDLAGHVSSQTYPSGHTVAYNYDIAGRLGDKDSNNLAFAGNLGDGVQRTYDSISGANAYDAASRMQEEKYGTLTPLYHKQHFNIRGQLYDIRLSTTPWVTDQWNWNRGAITNSYDSRMTHQDPNSGPDNNGNLLRSETWAPNDDQISGYNWTQQNYSYDSLNRLKSVAEYPGTSSGLGAQSFVQAYSYDVWGNRKIDPSTTQNSWLNRLQVDIDTGSNRLYAQGDLSISDPTHRLIQYDAAGNQTNDNYSANWQGQRSYDGENRMRSVTSTASVTDTYTYDADGRRVRRNIAGAETWQIYGMDGELLAEYSANAATFVPHEEYGYRNGQLLVTAANGDEQRLTNFIQNFYWRFFLGFTSNDVQTRVNALATAGNQGGSSQLLTEARNQAQAIVSQSNIASDTDYVTALYRGYLQRFPDSAGLSYWVSQVQSQGRNAVRDAIAYSGEFTMRVNNLWGTASSETERTDAFVQYEYNAILHRWASSSEDTAAISTFDNAGATGQANVINTAKDWARALFNSNEYTSRPNLTPHDFVYDLYQAFLPYAPDQAGWDWWTSQVGSDWHNKQAVMDSFINLGPYADRAGALYREVLWLIPDHLGTPRMIAERTGALVGIKRHDYLPFGEELFGGPPSQPGPGGRTTTQGYSANDSVRQKFTQKERDIETGLDYFAARYYSSTQGRFTSPDEPLIGQDEPNPQTWNLYSYTSNNPLSRIDEDGRRWFYRKTDGGWEVQWVNPNDDGTYTSPSGAGWNAFVPQDKYDNLVFYSSDGYHAYYFGERSDGSPRAFSFWTGKVENKPDHILAATFIFQDILNLARASFTAWQVARIAATEEIKTVATEAGATTVEQQVVKAAAGKITGFTKHGINQAISRDGVGVASRAILDAVSNPIKVITGRASTKYIGRNATVVLNKAGKVITTWARNSAGRRGP